MGDGRGVGRSDLRDKVIVVAAGAIVVGLPADGRSASLDAGERLELPAGTRHDALVGPSGVTCLEGHLAAGRFMAVARRAAGEW